MQLKCLCVVGINTPAPNRSIRTLTLYSPVTHCPLIHSLPVTFLPNRNRTPDLTYFRPNWRICGSACTPRYQAACIAFPSPNREGSKIQNGQISSVALMDARSIAATAANKGYLTPATDFAGEYKSGVSFGKFDLREPGV